MLSERAVNRNRNVCVKMNWMRKIKHPENGWTKPKKTPNLNSKRVLATNKRIKLQQSRVSFSPESVKKYVFSLGVGFIFTRWWGRYHVPMHIKRKVFFLLSDGNRIVMNDIHFWHILIIVNVNVYRWTLLIK